MNARDKWNEKHLNGEVALTQACAALKDFSHLIPATGKALDVACGLGGNARFLATRGLDTLAVDISDVAVAKINAHARIAQLPLQAAVFDLENGEFPPGKFDVVTVSHYLHRELSPRLLHGLAPGGILIYQTFTQENPLSAGPDSARFRLAPNELLALFGSLRLIAYREEGFYGDISQGMRSEAFLIAVNAA